MTKIVKCGDLKTGNNVLLKIKKNYFCIENTLIIVRFQRVSQ